MEAKDLNNIHNNQPDLKVINHQDEDLFGGQENLVHAGFFIRLAAITIDLTVVVIISLFALFLVCEFILKIPTREVLEKQGTIINIITLIVNSSYFTFLTYLKGQTFGKFVFKLEVVHAEPDTNLNFFQVFIREYIGKYLSFIVFLLGYLLAMIGGKNKHRSLHDYIVNTLVIKKTNT